MVNGFLQQDYPFAESNTPLRNTVSGKLSPSETATSFLISFKKLVQDKYKIFETERMDRKTKILFAPIDCNTIFSFKSMPTEGKKTASQDKALLKQFCWPLKEI